MEFELYPSNENSSSKIYNFYGLNSNIRGTRGEMEDMQNIASNEYPCIAPRGKRERVVSMPTTIVRAVSPDNGDTNDISSFTGISNGSFYYNGNVVSKVKRGGAPFDVELPDRFKWSIVRKSNLYIINGYDKEKNECEQFYYNIDTDVFDWWEACFTDLIIHCETSYNTAEDVINLYDGSLGEYSCTKSDGTVLSTSRYNQMYPKKNLFPKYFKPGDEIEILGVPTADNYEGQVFGYKTDDREIVPCNILPSGYFEGTVDIEGVKNPDDVSEFVITRAVIESVFDGGIKVKLYNKNGEVQDMGSTYCFRDLSSVTSGFLMGVTIRVKPKKFNNIAVHNGRIFGTSPVGDMIYASASDDFLSFNSEDVIKKFGARIPSDTGGRFTGLSTYNNDLIAFKENSITVISGNNPANYFATVIENIGAVSDSCICATPKGIIFLSLNGFYIYDGAMPHSVSSKLKNKYVGGVSGFDGNRYYVSARCFDGKYELITYDMRYGTWYKEDDLCVTDFFRFKNGFYAATGTDILRLEDGDFDGEWSFTLMPTHENRLDFKGINELWIRTKLEDGASFSVFTSVDGGEFRCHSHFTEPGFKIYRCPIRHKTGESYRIRLTGTGQAVITELEIKKADGGRRYKERSGD